MPPSTKTCKSDLRSVLKIHTPSSSTVAPADLRTLKKFGFLSLGKKAPRCLLTVFLYLFAVHSTLLLARTTLLFRTKAVRNYTFVIPVVLSHDLCITLTLASHFCFRWEQNSTFNGNSIPCTSETFFYLVLFPY